MRLCKLIQRGPNRGVLDFQVPIIATEMFCVLRTGALSAGYPIVALACIPLPSHEMKPGRDGVSSSPSRFSSTYMILFVKRGSYCLAHAEHLLSAFRGTER